MTLEQLESYIQQHPEIDREVDERAAAAARHFAQQKKNVIVEGRTQFHFLPESVKVYIKVDATVGAQRIWKDLQSKETKQQRNEGNLHSLEETKRRTQQREEEDAQRFKRIYHLDYRNESNYDLVLDSTEESAEEIAQRVLIYVQKRV